MKNLGTRILTNTGPWGQRPPEDRKPSSAQDLEAMLRDAQSRLRRSWPSGGGRPPFQYNSWPLLQLFLGVLAVWLLTGIYRVQPSEHAVLLTFGKWTETQTAPGLSWHLPWPVQDIRKVDIALDRRTTVGFQTDPAPRSRTARESEDTDSLPESLMLTGDENIINIGFVTLWRVSDAGKFLFNLRDPESTFKKVAESAMREVIGRTNIQKALTEGRADIESATKTLMQKILDDYQSGIVVNSVQLQQVNPPTPVVDAFDDVQRARADRERLKNEAETYANDIVPRARGDAQKTIQDAEAYKAAVIAKAQGEADRFSSVYEAYKSARDVTETRLYFETMQEILRNSARVIVSDGAAAPLPYLALDAKEKK